MRMDLWERGCERLAAELPEQQFNTWFRSLPPAEVSAAGDGYRVGLRVPNRFKMDWIRSQYGKRIEKMLSEIAGRPVRLELSLATAGVRDTAPAPLAEPPAAPRVAPPAPVQMSMIDLLPPLPVTPEPALAVAAPARPAARTRAARAATAPAPAPIPAPPPEPEPVTTVDAATTLLMPPVARKRAARSRKSAAAAIAPETGSASTLAPLPILLPDTLDLALMSAPVAPAPTAVRPSRRKGLNPALAVAAAPEPAVAPPPAARPTAARKTVPRAATRAVPEPIAASAALLAAIGGEATAAPPRADEPAPVPAPAAPASRVTATPAGPPLSSSALSASAALAKASAAVASRRKRAGAGTTAAAIPPAAAPVVIAATPALVVPAPASVLAAPAVIIPPAPPAPTALRGRINPALTFDTLVPGRANQMARTAALHVVGSPGGMYNPLFLYGGVGLGKTHLIHAVGNALLREKQDARVLYLHAEQFISDVVRNYQRKTFDELKAKYHSLDLLLIDDVQFFAGKERTQEEFFNAFEALLAKRAHIIMTSDTYPKGLVDIDERLTSRFDAGLTVAIEPPELEMRVAILIKKAIAEGSMMPEDVAFFVAKNVRANVRELEGALRKVLAYSRFSNKAINIALAREALKDLLSIQNRQISVENIQKTVADFYKIKIADMYSKKRPASIARPRQIAMYLAKEMTQKSLPEIGELFGGRDHTTVLYAVRKIAGERQKNTELNQQLHVLEQTLKG